MYNLKKRTLVIYCAPFDIISWDLKTVDPSTVPHGLLCLALSSLVTMENCSPPPPPSLVCMMQGALSEREQAKRN